MTVPTAEGPRFAVQVTDDNGALRRVLVLYRRVHSTSWSPLDLTYDIETKTATGALPRQNGTIEFVVQAVDGTGNVSIALDHGNPWTAQFTQRLYLPTVRR